ncbi:unnamed protein product [Ilex paraguariensis]|uniref:CCT domain-containing protein n=1 Tax=Ilex paraguariensis TaxID=185542 RepID=A0ABC8SHE0_9AQUA
MASDLFVYENTFFSDPFSPFIESLIDHDSIFQAISDTYHNSAERNPLDETNSLDQSAPTLLSSSPPSHQLGNLSLYQHQTTHLATASSISANRYADFTVLEVKTEECRALIDSLFSYSNNFFEPQTQGLSSPANNSSIGQIRRVCSTGDLPKIKTAETSHKLSSNPLSTERSSMEEANFKVRRYSAEERKQRIHRYKAKRNQRNFNKTIKYACRKTLADNRPRIRGRFVRNDETGEIPKAATYNRYEDEDDLWIE